MLLSSARHSIDGKGILGLRAPMWINDTHVTRCQNCHNRFASIPISARRHHCRGCGRCVCASCSSKRATLDYCKADGDVRVCLTCYTDVRRQKAAREIQHQLVTTRRPGRTILFGDFRLDSSGSVVWVALEEDYRLHIYGAKLDEVEDDSIDLCDLLGLSYYAVTRTFSLHGISRTYRLTLEETHKTDFAGNVYCTEKIQQAKYPLVVYAELWLEAMRLARKRTVPSWYVNKRNSADSGVSGCDAKD